MLFDMHFHLGFCEEPFSYAKQAAACCLGGLATTVEPGEYEALKPSETPLLRVGLGLHPWWVADGRCGEDEMALFERWAERERFVGEVGLDFSPRWEFSRDAQVRAFERVVEACGDASRKVISLHAVRSADAVMEVLGRFGATNRHACVFHWFSGTSEELKHAVEQGFYFSVGERMLSTKRGRAYARAIPLDRLLLETDYPGEPMAEASPAVQREALEQALRLLAEVRGETADALSACIASTSASLLECGQPITPR